MSSPEIDYQFDEEARGNLNEEFKQTLQHLRNTDRTEYLNLTATIANAFGLTPTTVRRYTTGEKDFVTKTNPHRIGGRADGISGGKVADMRTAFAKALILGQGETFKDKLKLGIDKGELKEKDFGLDIKKAGQELRKYLKDDYTRSKGLRLKTKNGMFAWEYFRYDNESDPLQGSEEITNWSTTIQDWNPRTPQDFRRAA